jgi:hypothetical protein
MSDTIPIQLQRPKRADARRNYDKLVAAARATFAEDGTSAPLEDIAQRAGVVRADTSFIDIARLIGGIAMVPTTEPGQKERLVDLALDGLRYRPDAS